jgi:predicted transcriptional regulator
MKKTILIWLLTVGVSFGNDVISVDEIENAHQLKAELLSNNNISLLEVNYIYTQLLNIVDDVMLGDVNKSLLNSEFFDLIDYVKEIVDRDDTVVKKNELWNYILENPREVYVELNELKARLDDEYKMVN